MCYICSCFAWSIDLAQRVITFGLACILSCAVCFGLSIAVIAGIAYGYNYSMAEFMTFTRSDVTVYMRRGQFFDKPDLGQSFRRSGEDEDLFTSNRTTDYEDNKPPVEGKPLSDTWLKTQDTRKYAEILTRYSPNKREEVVDLPPMLEPRPTEKHRRPHPPVITQVPPQVNFRKPPETISIMPNPILPTASWRSGSSDILMRNYKPLQDYTSVPRNTAIPELLFPTPEEIIPGVQSLSKVGPKEKSKEKTFHGKDETHKSHFRAWGTTPRHLVNDETEEVDEENIVYKPI